MHRLVALHFLGLPPTPSHVVNHIDGNRSHNAIRNLQYATQSENVRHSLALRKARRSCGKAVQVRTVGERLWQQYPSIKRAADALGVSVTSVSMCCHGKAASCRGQEFQFVQESDLPAEEWRDAVDPKTRCALLGYRISSYGRVHGPTGIRTFGRCIDGYRCAWIQGRNLRIHRIMAYSFLNVPVSDMSPWEVHHRDGNKSNNYVANLEVVTHQENVVHAWRMRTNREVVSLRRPVEAKHLATGDLHTFESITEAAQHVVQATSGSIISTMCDVIACCKGWTKSFGGYEWQYYCHPSDDGGEWDEVWKDVHIADLISVWDAGCTPNRIDGDQCKRGVQRNSP